MPLFIITLWRNHSLAQTWRGRKRWLPREPNTFRLDIPPTQILAQHWGRWSRRQGRSLFRISEQRRRQSFAPSIRPRTLRVAVRAAGPLEGEKSSSSEQVSCGSRVAPSPISRSRRHDRLDDVDWSSIASQKRPEDTRQVDPTVAFRYSRPLTGD